MKTEILQPTTENISYAAKILKDGGIVAMPTETVYGIAADCTNGDAVKKIFIAKGRPQDNPLIVHIADMGMLNGIVSEVPPVAYTLADAFWPGPLTMIMPRGSALCDETCAGLQSVGVRFPSHPVAQALILAAGVPLSAPSANISGKPSPTNAQDVLFDMNGRLPVILDGGDSFAGVESTVISLLNGKITLLRPGYVTKEQIEEVTGEKVEIASAITAPIQKEEKVLSPGMKYKHYAPDAELTLVKGSFEQFKSFVAPMSESNTYYLVFDGEENAFQEGAIAYGKEGDGTSQAHNLFKVLRDLDRMGARKVYARCPSDTGVSLAVYNRMLRAAAFRVVDLTKGEKE